MKYILLIIAVLVLLSENKTFGQSITWQKVMNNYGVFRKAQECSDGGYIACGSDRIYPQNLSKVYLVKYNKYGDTSWIKRYDLNTNLNFDGFWIQETFDKGFIIGGANHGKGYILKTDSLGNEQWHKIYYSPEIIQVYCIKQIYDNGYIGLLRETTFGTEDIRVIRLDSLGNSIWDRTFINSTEELVSEVLVKNEYFYLLGIKGPINIPNILLMKFNYNGDTLWTKYFGGNDLDAGYSIDSTDDNGFIIGGYSKSFNNFNDYESYIIKLDSNGLIQWQRNYKTYIQEICASVRIVPSKGYVFCGWSRAENTEYAFIKLIDKNGNIIIEKFYSGDERSNNFYSVENTNDKGFILCGVAINSNGNPKSYIVKTDSLGYALPIGIIKNNRNLSSDIFLYQNYPNPFNPSTMIKYYIPKDGMISIKVYDISGREILNTEIYRTQGEYEYIFNGSKLSSGVYFYQLEYQDKVYTKKMLLVK